MLFLRQCVVGSVVAPAYHFGALPNWSRDQAYSARKTVAANRLTAAIVRFHLASRALRPAQSTHNRTYDTATITGQISRNGISVWVPPGVTWPHVLHYVSFRMEISFFCLAEFVLARALFDYAIQREWKMFYIRVFAKS